MLIPISGQINGGYGYIGGGYICPAISKQDKKQYELNAIVQNLVDDILEYDKIQA